MKVLSIIGTRPEAIKMAPVIKELGRYPDRIQSVVCVTGQHRQMLDQALDLFGIKPDFDLNLMHPGQGLSELTGRLFSSLDSVVGNVHPDWILAQGDTTTVMVSAMVGYYHKVRFGHVEAGLRTGNKWGPFPEEVNRRVADLVAEVYFAPTEGAAGNLRAEGYPEKNIFVTGNTVVDALMEISSREYDWSTGPLAGLPLDKRLVLITAHRRENFGESFRNICLAIRELAGRFSGDGVHFVFPVHLNPNVRGPVGEILSDLGNVGLIEPLDYLSLVHLMKRSALVLTDSGGIQEEAPSFSVPVLVLREMTERPEGVEAGMVKVVGTDGKMIVEEALKLLEGSEGQAHLRVKSNPYGDGRAAPRIVSILLERSKE